MDIKSAVEEAGPRGIVQLGPKQYQVSSDVRSLAQIIGPGRIKLADLSYEEATCDDWKVVPPEPEFQVGDTVKVDDPDESFDYHMEIVYIDSQDMCALKIVQTGELGVTREIDKLTFISRPDKPKVYVFKHIMVIRAMISGRECFYPILDGSPDDCVHFLKPFCDKSLYHLSVEEI